MSEIKIDADAAREALKNLSPRLLLIIPAIIVLAVAFTSYFTVPADSEAIILRFGKFNRTAAPGLNFKFPFWFETKEIIPVERRLKMEFGYGTRGATNPYQSRPQEHLDEQSMITGDKNAAAVEPPPKICFHSAVQNKLGLLRRPQTVFCTDASFQ